MNAKAEEFLREYEAICRKHGLFIYACGCCGSPWVAGLDPDEDGGDKIGDHIKHLSSLQMLSTESSPAESPG